MDAGADMSVLQRMAQAGGQSGSAAMSPLKAWRQALPKAAEDLLGLPLSVMSAEAEALTLDALMAAIGEAEGHLLLSLRGPGQARGVAMLDPQLLAGLIEVQTLGRVLNRAAEPRAPTRTDAAICEDLLNQAFEGYCAAWAGQAGYVPTAGFAVAGQVGDPRLIALMLEDQPYQMMRLSLDLQGGAKQGQMVLGFPATPAEGATQDGASGWHEALRRSVGNCEAQLMAVLHQWDMPLAQVQALRPGQVLHLPASALGAVQLTGQNGQVAGRGQLGQKNGMRAVRLGGPQAIPASPPLPEPAPLPDPGAPPSMPPPMASPPPLPDPGAPPAMAEPMPAPPDLPEAAPQGADTPVPLDLGLAPDIG